MTVTNSMPADCSGLDRVAQGTAAEIGDMPLRVASGETASAVRWLPRLAQGLLGVAALAVATAADSGRSAAEAQPAAPTNAAATPGDTQITVTWEKVAGVDGYRVQLRKLSLIMSATPPTSPAKTTQA